MNEFSPPYFVIPMPVDAQGRGPETDPEKQVKVLYEVWDENNCAVGIYENEKEATEALDKLLKS